MKSVPPAVAGGFCPLFKSMSGKSLKPEQASIHLLSQAVLTSCHPVHDSRFTIHDLRASSVLDPVQFYLEVQRGGLDVQ